MARLYVLVLLLIAYGSLSPWRIDHPPRPFRTELTPFGGDIAVNILVYVPVGFFGVLALSRRLKRVPAAIVALLLGLTLSIAAEAVQRYVPPRTATVMDILANTGGTALGVLAAVLWHVRTIRNLENLLLAATWAGAEILRSVTPQSSTGFTPFALTFVQALAVVALLRSYRIVLGLAGLKLCFARDLPSLIEVGIVLIAFAIIRWLRPPPAWIAGALVLAVTLRGLAPFHFEAQHPFHWVPFQASLSYDWRLSLTGVLIKTFRYGAIIRFLQLAGVRLWPATAATAALLGAIEIVQVRLPMHIAEITDVVVALVLGLAFWVIESDPWYFSEEKAKDEPDLRLSRTQ